MGTGVIALAVVAYWLMGLGALAILNSGPHGLRPPGGLAVLIVAAWPMVVLSVGVAVVVGWGLGTVERMKWKRTRSLTVDRDGRVHRERFKRMERAWEEREPGGAA